MTEKSSSERGTSQQLLWVAVSYGALDVRRWHENESSLETILLPILPIDEPIGLEGEPATLWRRLTESGPIADEELTDSEQELVREFESFGLASRRPGHPARVTHVAEPWLSAPFHEMVYALVGSVARDAGLDVVFFKGPMLHLQGLRDREHSLDVDVMVNPSQLADLRNLLLDWGWTVKPTIWDGTDASHSLTLLQDRWGCGVDAHRMFPGIGLPALDSFRTLREHAESLRFASVEVLVPSRAMSGVLFALNVMRPVPMREGTRHQVDQAVDVLTRCGPEGIDVARALCATGALEQALNEAYPQQELVDCGPLPANWVRLMQPTRAKYYLTTLRQVPWQQKPRLVLRMLWPPKEVVIASSMNAGLPRAGGFKARMSRFRRGLATFRRR